MNNIINGLSVVATPIGNLDDLTVRAEKVLRESSIILCEKKERALKLVSHLGLKNLSDESLEINILIIIAIVLSFLFSYITVKFFLNYLNKFSLNIFVIYRLIIALILLAIIYL